MKIRVIVAVTLLLPVMAFAQTGVRIIGGQTQPTATAGNTAPAFATATAGNTAPAFPLPGGFHMPPGVLEQFWNDPAVAGELRLSDVQRKQLQNATLTQRLSMIDGGADALKALVRLSAIYEADQLDDVSYKQQLSNFATAVGKLVQDAGEMAVTPRRVLTSEQWTKLQSLQRAKQAAARVPVPSRPQATRTPAAGDRQ